MLQSLELTNSAKSEILVAMEKEPPANQPPFPNNLAKLMERDGVTAKQICEAWNVQPGDVSQRINQQVSITPRRREILTKNFGWTASEIFETPQSETAIVNEKSESEDNNKRNQRKQASGTGLTPPAFATPLLPQGQTLPEGRKLVITIELI